MLLLHTGIMLLSLNAQKQSHINKRFIFNLENYNFCKNAEYFNPFTDGYTNLGYFLKPTVVFSLNNQINLNGGFHFLKFSGGETFKLIQPVFTVTWKIEERFEMKLGTLKGGKNHNLTEPVYYTDHHWLNNVENGIQFLYKTNLIETDLWLNWMNHVGTSDIDQEKFMLGFTGKILCPKEIKRYRVSFPLQFVFVHRGGQGDYETGRVESLANFSAGVEFSINFEQRLLHSVTINNNWLGYNDFSPTKQQPFTKGFGNLSSIEIKSKQLLVDFGYWYAYHFISPMGNPMFQSVSERISGFTFPTRKLYIAGAHFMKPLYNGVEFRAGMQGFFDPMRKEFDYLYSLFLVINIKDFSQ